MSFPTRCLLPPFSSRVLPSLLRGLSIHPYLWGCLCYNFVAPEYHARFQPLHAGIFGAVNARYRKAQCERALDLRYEGIGNIYNIDLLLAMRWIRQIWSSLPPQLIEKCWNHAGLIHSAHTAGLTR